jgi:hypothetical protein
MNAAQDAFVLRVPVREACFTALRDWIVMLLARVVSSARRPPSLV